MALVICNNKKSSILILQKNDLLIFIQLNQEENISVAKQSLQKERESERERVR